MRNTEHRLAAMEAKLAPRSASRRVYAVTGGGEDEDPADFVRAQGFDYDADDMIVHLVDYRPSPDGTARVMKPFGWVGRPPSREQVE